MQKESLKQKEFHVRKTATSTHFINACIVYRSSVLALILCINISIVPREGGLYIILKGRVQETLKDSETGEYTTNIVSTKNVRISKCMIVL